MQSAIETTTLFNSPESPARYGTAADIAVGADGLVHAPTEPGLGARIDFELIERKKIAVLS